MALQVWLPLTKDLRNQGLNGVAVSNSGATYSATGGKLGGCYIFDGVDDSIGVGNLSTIVNTEFSFCCWFYKNEWGSKGYETIFGGPSGFELESKVSTTNSPVLKLYNWGGGSCSYELSKWNHIVFTRNTTETKLYLNGELAVTGTAGTIPNNNYFVGSWNSTTQQNFKGKMCDVRIYDHCLSEMEVKQISQGLVLHYPLNRNGWGQENILTNTGDLTQWSKESGITVTWDEDEQMYKMVDTSHTSSRWGMYQNFTVTPSTTYTFSVEGKAGDNTTAMGIQTWESSTGWSANRYTFTSTKTKGVYTFTTGASDTVGRIYLNIIIASTGNKTAWFKNPKLELGSITTPWCPNSADTLATTIELNGTTEYDCSGFCNNGIRTGALTWTSDTPKYAVGTKFTGTQYITGTSPTTNGATLAAWVKTTSTSNQALVIDYKSGLGMGFWSSYIIPSCNSAIKTTYPNSAYHVNEWNHIVIVKNSSSSILCYVNGELQNAGSAQDYWSTNVIDGFSIAARPNGASPSTCQISDVRIYATALSADDVKSLYQNSAYIDSSGNVYGTIHEV